MTTPMPMGEFGDEPDTDTNPDNDPVVETADEYGQEPEPGYAPPPDDAAAPDQNPGFIEGAHT